MTQVAAEQRPNVVTLYVDDLGYRDIGCYGGPVKTPVLDKLAAGGVRFTDFHSGAPTCSPSRATFLTGRNHHRTGVYSVLDERFHRMHLLKSEKTIAEVLKENGYATAHFGKWHLGMPVQNRDNPTPADHGFDYWFGVVNGPGRSHKNPTNFLRNGKRVGEMKGYSCQIVVDEALTWIDQKRDGDEPFYLNLWFNEPHDPIAAPDEIVSQYGGLNQREAIYSGTIDNTDRAIGRLVAKLEKLGELDNTIIIYASDNGSYLQKRNGELRGKKGSLFEGGHRVPGIFYWKDGIPGGRVEKEPAGVVDLLPTLCGLIGIDKPEGVHLDGSDLAPLLTGSGSFKRHQPLFWMAGTSMVMRVGDHTLFASSTAKSPIDFKTANRLMEQVKEVLGDDLEKELGGMDLRSRMFNGKFANPEANRLRDQHRRLFYFQESWIPELKKSGLGRVQLYDLSKDLGQQNDIAKERPDLSARLKKQAATIYRSVMADAPEWAASEEPDAAKKSQSRSRNRQEFRPPRNGSPQSTKVSTTSATKESRKRHNVVLIFADDMGYGDVTCYDAKSKIHTPNLDRLAKGGMRFTDAHSASAVCTPSRYALLTGRYAWRTGLKSGVLGGFSQPLIEKGRMTVADIFQSKGYRTACIGKWHLGMDWSGGIRGANGYNMRNNSQGIDFTKPIQNTAIVNGFDEYFGIAASLDMPPYVFIRNDRVTGQPTSSLKEEDKGGRQGPAVPGWRHKHVLPTLTDEVISFIQRNEQSPFFVYMPLNAPHTPHAPGDAFVGKSKLDIYGDFMVEVDHHIGRVMDELDRLKLSDNTLVIVTSDNGPETNMYQRRDKFGHDSSSHFLGAKRDNWEGGHRVPFIARWPGVITSGSKCDTPFCLVDMMATFAEMVSVELPQDQGVDSVSILPLMQGAGDDSREDHAIIHHSSTGRFAIRRGDWKLLLHAGSGGNGYGAGQRSSRYNGTIEQKSFSTANRQLYNIQADPDETTNLIEKRPEVVAELTALASEYVRKGRSTPGPQQKAVLQNWPQLDWLSVQPVPATSGDAPDKNQNTRKQKK